MLSIRRLKLGHDKLDGNVSRRKCEYIKWGRGK